MPRFQTVPIKAGVAVLDTETGQLVLVTPGGEVRELRTSVVVRPESVMPSADGLQRDWREIARRAMAGEARRHVALDQADELDQLIVRTFPYPIAAAHLAYLSESEPRQRCWRLVDVFTALVKTWALLLTSEYLFSTTVNDARVDEALANQLSRPLLSSWVMLVDCALAAFERANAPLFAPEIGTVWKRLRRETSVPLRVASDDERGRRRHHDQLHAAVDALLKYRNVLAHGFGHADRRARSDLTLYDGVLRQVLEESRFMSGYGLYAILDATNPQSALVTRLLGAIDAPQQVTIPIDTIDVRTSPMFLRNESSGALQRLYTFFDFGDAPPGASGIPGLESKDVFVFERNSKKSIVYVSAEGDELERTERLGLWRKLLGAKSIEVSGWQEPLALDRLRALSRRVSRATLEPLIDSGKFLPELTKRRRPMEGVFNRFEDSDNRGLVLVGESGSGKTTLLAHEAQERMSAADGRDVVLFYRASALTVKGETLTKRVLRDLGLEKSKYKDIATFLQSADDSFKTSGTRLWVLVDALNEHPEDLLTMARGFDELVQKMGSFGWCRAVATIRKNAYDRLQTQPRARQSGSGTFEFGATGGRYLRDADTLAMAVEISPLTLEEVGELYEAYRKYRHSDPETPGVSEFVFRPQTAFADFSADASTVQYMRNPLRMRLLLAAYNKVNLRDDVDDGEALALYRDKVVLDGVRHGSPREAFLDGVVELLDQQQRDWASGSELDELEKTIMGTRSRARQSPFQQLIDLGVLLVEWDQEGECHVRFAFDNLLEYLLSLRYGSDHSPEGILNIAERAADFPSCRGALGFILQKFAASDSGAVIAEAFDLCHNAHPARAVLVDVAAAVFSRLARSHVQQYESVLETLAEPPSERDIEVLCKAASRMISERHYDRADKALRVAEGEAAALDRVDLRAQVAQLRGTALSACDRNAEAVDVLRSAERFWEVIENGGSSEVLRPAEHLRATRLELARALRRAIPSDADKDRRHVETEEIRRLLDVVHASATRSGNLVQAAQALREAANVEATRDPVQQARLLEAALGLAREANDTRTQTHCLMGMARVKRDASALAKARRDDALARSLLEEAMDWERQALDRARGSDTLDELTCYVHSIAGFLVLGDLEEAETLHRQAMPRFRRAGDEGQIHNLFGVWARVLLVRGRDAARVVIRRREHVQMLDALGRQQAAAAARCELAIALHSSVGRDPLTLHAGLREGIEALDIAIQARRREWALHERVYPRWIAANLALELVGLGEAKFLHVAREHERIIREQLVAGAPDDDRERYYAQALDLRLATHETARIDEILELAERVRSCWMLTRHRKPEAHDAPTSTWLDVALALQRAGRVQEARHWLANADATVGTQFVHPRAGQIEALRHVLAQVG
jgi:hypothetical protein